MCHNAEGDVSGAQQLKVSRIYNCVGSLLTAERSFWDQIFNYEGAFYVAWGRGQVSCDQIATWSLQIIDSKRP